MNRLRMKSVLAVSVLVLSCVATAGAQKPAMGNDADSAAIKHSLDDWASAYNRHDPHGASVGFTENAEMVSIAGLLFEGRKGIEDHYGRTFTTSLVNAHRVDTVKRIRYLSPTIASVDVDWEITGSLGKTADDHSEIPSRKGILTLIFVKKDGQWLADISHEIEFAAPKPKKAKE